MVATSNPSGNGMSPLGYAVTFIGPLAQKVLRNTLFSFLTSMRNYAPMEAVLRAAGSFEGAIDNLPGAINVVMERFAQSHFRDESVSDFFRETAVRVSEAIVDAVHAANGQELKYGEVEQAAQAAAKAVADKEMVIDESGNVHKPDCPNVAGRNLKKVTFAVAAERGLTISPCCQKAVREDAKVRVQAVHGRRSPLDVIGSMPEADQRDFMDWVMTLSAEDRRAVMDGLPELDTDDEFRGLMALVRLGPEHAVEFLPLLKERAEKAAELKRWLSEIGKAVLHGARDVLKVAKSSYAALARRDAAMAPVAARQKARAMAALAKARKPPPWSVSKLIKF